MESSDEAQLLTEITGKTHIVRMDVCQLGNLQLIDLLALVKTNELNEFRIDS